MVASRQTEAETAEELAKTILATSVECAEHIEREYSRTTQGGRKLKDKQFQAVVTEFVILLSHLSDRDAFGILGPTGRATFMDMLATEINRLGTTSHMNAEHRLPAFTSKIDKDISVVGLELDLLNKRQDEYADYKELLRPSDEGGLRGTLHWEFGRYVADIIDAPGAKSLYRLIATHLGSEAYTAILPTLSNLRKED